MDANRLKNYFENLSSQKGIPKFVFIFISLTFLSLSLIFSKIVEINYRNSYKKTFEEKVISLNFDLEENGNRSFEVYYNLFNQQLPESSSIKNISFIFWNTEGKVLWHSNKLVEKIVENGTIKNDNLIKGFNILDIPEKNFKPYDTFNLNRGKLVLNKFNTDFQKNAVHHFYKLPGIKNIIYVEILREFHNIVPRNLYLYLMIASILISGIFSYLTFLLFKIILHPLTLMKKSMESYIKNKNVDLIYHYSENESGQLIKTYNMFLSKLTTYSENHFDDSDGKNQKVIDYLQEMLLKKSIQKSNQMELLLYPKHPETDFRMFVTIEEHDNVTFILYVHFDINNIQSNLEKHIIQDRFKELSLKSNSIHEISRELFKDLVTHADLGPGFLLIRLYENEMEWVRSGPFHMYLVNSMSGESALLEGGVDYLPNDLVVEEKIELKGQLLLIVSDDIMELLNVDAVEFNNLVIWFPEDSTRNGKLILSEILSHINNINPEVLKQSPMLSLIRLK